MSAGVRPARTQDFEEFSWLSDDLLGDAGARFAARMKDLGYGVQTCLKLIEASELEQEHCRNQDPVKEGAVPDVPMLNAFYTGTLMRLAITVSGIIGAEAEEFLDVAQARFDDAATRGERAKLDAGVGHE
jgi:hypothetical protein